MTLVSFTVGCPRCGRDMRQVERQDPRWAYRERRLVVECVHCRHVATLVLTLVDGIAARTVAS